MTNANFLKKAKELKVPDNFIEFLTTNGIADVESVALLASTEQEVDAKILAVAKNGGKEVVGVGGEIAVKKFWVACRKQFEAGKAGGKSTANEDGVPEDDANDIKKMWKELHGFVLPDAWSLTGTAQKQVWKDATAATPIVSVLLMEQLRLVSSLVRPTGTLMSMVPGKPTETYDLNVDSVADAMEVFVRARAWLMTTAYYSVASPQWLSLQTAIFASDKIMGLALQTNRGQGPPVAHLCAAWAATVMYWSESARISGNPLGQFVMNTGAWEHKWAWTPNASVGGQRQIANTSVDLPREVQSELERLRQVAKDHQSMMDRNRNFEKGKGGGGGNVTYKGNKNEFFDNGNNGKGSKSSKSGSKSKGGFSSRRERSPRRFSGRDSR